MVRRNRHAWRTEQEALERIGEKLETELRRTQEN